MDILTTSEGQFNAGVQAVRLTNRPSKTAHDRANKLELRALITRAELHFPDKLDRAWYKGIEAGLA